MRDPYNPTRDEIRAWAYEKGALEPEQDWDLHLARLGEFDLYVELAGADDCPNWSYFIRLLYFIVGDAVRSDYRTLSRRSLEDVLALTDHIPKFRFYRLRQRAADLMSEPASFDYHKWCGGGLIADETTESYPR
jgi:hypothetical protein